MTGWVERRRPARQGHGHDHVSPAALALAASLRAAGAPEATASARDCQMFPCSLKRFKIKFDLPNCHSGLVRLELNNNKKKQRKHGKDATKLAPRATSPDNAWR
jgi:hypothetical protein